MSLRRHKNRRRADFEQEMAALKSRAGRLARALIWACVAGGLLCALFLGALSAYRWLRRAPQLALKSVTFRGLQHAGRGDLLRLAGLSLGQNLFDLEPGSLERAMAAHPWVDSARVVRQFPCSLLVWIKEHQPAAVVALGELYLIDGEGRPFKKVQHGDPTDLPLITGLQREEFVDNPEQSRLRVRQALDLAEAYSRSAAASENALGEVRIGRTTVSLVTAQGQEVRLSEGEPAEALRRLKEIRAEIDRRGLSAQVIHLENRARPGWIAVKLSNAVADKKGSPLR
jgi:cell division protein FtsQ